MTVSEQLRLLPEGADQCRAALHRAQVTTRAMREVAKVAGAEVRHGVMLQVSPDALAGIELGGVGGQVLERDGAALSLDVLPDELGAVSLEPVPDDQQLPVDGGLQGLEKLDDLWGADRPGMQTEVEPPE